MPVLKRRRTRLKDQLAKLLVGMSDADIAHLIKAAEQIQAGATLLPMASELTDGSSRTGEGSTQSYTQRMAERADFGEPEDHNKGDYSCRLCECLHGQKRSTIGLVKHVRKVHPKYHGLKEALDLVKSWQAEDDQGFHKA